MARRSFRISATAILVVCILSGAAAEEEKKRVVALSPGPEWKMLSTFSGKTDYYSVVEENGEKLIRARYEPKLDTVILYRKLHQARKYSVARWKWRVKKFPVDANETIPGRMDSATAVYVYFQSGIKKYVIKYVWSVALQKGTNFLTSDSNFLNKMQLVALEGPPGKTDVWVEEEVNIAEDFKRFFLGGKDEEIPNVVGVGVLTDGDGTKSVVEADYAGFQLSE